MGLASPAYALHFSHRRLPLRFPVQVGRCVLDADAFWAESPGFRGSDTGQVVFVERLPLAIELEQRLLRAPKNFCFFGMLALEQADKYAHTFAVVDVAVDSAADAACWELAVVGSRCSSRPCCTACCCLIMWGVFHIRSGCSGVRRLDVSDSANRHVVQSCARCSPWKMSKSRAFVACDDLVVSARASRCGRRGNAQAAISPWPQAPSWKVPLLRCAFLFASSKPSMLTETKSLPTRSISLQNSSSISVPLVNARRQYRGAFRRAGSYPSCA